MVILVMTVKNEAENLARTLRSALPAIDAYLINDTGSTDGTPEIAREILGHLDGDVILTDFVDFSTSYNRMIDRSSAYRGAIFWLHLMGDEELIGAKELRAWCEDLYANRLPESPGAHYIEIESMRTSWDLARLGWHGRNWRYRGRTHEVLMANGGMGYGEPPGPRIPGVKIRRIPTKPNPEAIRRRWEADLALLYADLKDRPGDARTLYYVAQTYECLGRPWEAIHFYRQQIKAGGWPPYNYEAAFRMGWIYYRQGRSELAQEHWIQASRISPERAEPLVAIAQVCLHEEKLGAALLFAEMACDLKHPPEPNKLFVREDIWGAERWETLGAVRMQMGEKQAAIGYFQHAHFWRMAQKEKAATP